MKRTESLGYVINQVARQFARALQEQIAPLEAVPGQFAQLLALYEEDGVTQQDLCEKVQVEQPTMANTLARMERDGLVARRPHPTDGRKQLVFLTAAAVAKREQLMAVARRVNERATHGLTSRRAKALLETLGVAGARLARDEDASGA